MKSFFSLSHISAGFIAVLVGYTSSAAIIFQAAASAGADAAEISSWLWALGIGMGVTSAGLSLYYRSPVLTAWSTPGAALLVSALAGASLAEATGVFIFCSSLILITGITGWFDQLMRLIPMPLASAMLAGVLVEFGFRIFAGLEANLWLTGFMLLAFLILRPTLVRYAVPLTLLIGIIVASIQGDLNFAQIDLEISVPVWTTPTFSLNQLIGIGIPLFIVTMASQNVPGIAVMRANGYQTPASPIISWTGLTGVVLAPFGGFAFNFAAITAAICMGDEAGEDRRQRYMASVWAGIFYFITGILGATVVALFAAFPDVLIWTIAGLALLSTIGNSLANSLEQPQGREAALLTFLTTASGVTLFGIGSAFWGLLLGLLVHMLQTLLQRR